MSNSKFADIRKQFCSCAWDNPPLFECEKYEFLEAYDELQSKINIIMREIMSEGGYDPVEDRIADPFCQRIYDELGKLL
jgi:hypothetical protein